MRLEKASYKAVQYACMNFHYAKSVPVNVTGFSVFNDKNDWCGVILYGSGANNHIAAQYNLNQGEVIELVRMALNGKQESTGKALSISMKIIKKYVPLCKLLISYSDRNQGHYGTIYQATNWYYVGDSKTSQTPTINGKRIHAKSIYSKYGTNSIDVLRNKGINIQYSKDEPKHKYIYPLHKSLIPLCKSLCKSYPKNINATLPHKGEGETIQSSGAFDSTMSLNNFESTLNHAT